MNLVHKNVYDLIRFFARIVIRNNFEKIVYINDEVVPDDVPVIFAPNHRNAVVDGLLLVNFFSKEIVFLARADFFRNIILRNFLKSLCVTPIYRNRDGRKNLSKNVDVFDACGKILFEKQPICIFPEGMHSPKQSLLPIQKGIPRIALPVEDNYNFSLDITVVPVIIYYTDMHVLLSDCYVKFCKPIRAVDYKDQYHENPNLAFNNMRHDMEQIMQSEMINVTHDEFYDDYLHCIDLCARGIVAETLPDRQDGLFIVTKSIVEKLDSLFTNENEKFRMVINRYKEAYNLLSQAKISSKCDIKNVKSDSSISLIILSLLLTSPFALYAAINCIFPIAIDKILNKVIKDKQFISSLRIVIALFVLPLFVIIQAVILGLCLHNWWIPILYALSIIPTFRVFEYWRKNLFNIVSNIRIKGFIRKHRATWERIQDLTDWHDWFNN